MIALLAPLALRRVRPVAVLLVVTVLFAVARVLEVPEGTMTSLALFVAIYSVGAWVADSTARKWSRVVAIIASIGLLVWSILGQTDYVNVDAVLATTFSVVINVASSRRHGGWAIWRVCVRRTKPSCNVVQTSWPWNARNAPNGLWSTSGFRIAGAARRGRPPRVGDRAPGRSGPAHPRHRSRPCPRRACTLVADSGSLAVGGLQKLVGCLGSATAATMAKTNHLDEVDRLLDQTRAAGIPVEKRVIGRERPVPASVALSAYRIIQEALTNTLKHAGSVPTTVVLTYTTGTLDVEVVNRRGAVASTPGGGHGLMGMRERVAMVGDLPIRHHRRRRLPGGRIAAHRDRVRRGHRMIRVLLVDDQQLVHGGRMIVDAEADVTVVGEAADGTEAVRMVKRERPTWC